jgi:hypothetical protein
MNREEEIKYFRENIINKYVEEVQEQMLIEEKLQSNLYKQCSKCGKVLPIESFYKNAIKKKGVFDYCKECSKAIAYCNQKNKKLSKQKLKEKQQQKLLNKAKKIALKILLA